LFQDWYGWWTVGPDLSDLSWIGFGDWVVRMAEWQSNLNTFDPPSDISFLILTWIDMISTISKWSHHHL
jgi:hypothetical protein